IPRHLARHHARRRRGGAPQHQPGQLRARPLHRSRGAPARHRGHRADRSLHDGAAAPGRSGHDLGPRPRSRRLSARRSRRRPPRGRAAGQGRPPARDFWSDVVRWDCTLFQYIGELCRYLLHAEPTACEAEHRIRLCCGNGLRPDVWEDFKRRFGIPWILEFYAATEGNVSMFNVEGKPGAIGRIPPFLAHRFPAALVRLDVAREAPARDAQGRCIRCATNEVGEAIGKIVEDPSNPGRRFEAYTSEEATEQKILRDVFEPGDAWFRTGDLMRRDEDDYYYFIDRVGDTFRWKGENVATLEVAEAICAFPGIREASVYGVAVPGAEGRAGMAAVVLDAELDLAALRAHLVDRLPGYARPLFLRVRSKLDATATFKHAKHELVRQGYDPAASADVVYFDDPERRAFVELDQALYERIQRGRIRL